MNATLGRLLCIVALAGAFGAARAQTAPAPVPGREFQVLSPAHPVSSGDRIEVIEFFYYGCPVCYETQPQLARWLQKSGNDILLWRVPAISTEGWDSFARTYYTLDAMGLLARLHWPVYDNHHFDGKRLNEEANVVAWVKGNGVDAERFTAIWHSAETTAKLDTAKKMLDAYGVRGVPTFVVDGKYLTSARLAGGVKEMIAVLDYLVARARAERVKK
jgi:thiol:disulfide interchange protein DsbA